MNKHEGLFLLFVPLMFVCFAGTATAEVQPDLALECEILDPATDQPKSFFNEGDRVKVRALVNVPQANMEADISVKTSLLVEVLGTKFNTPLKNWGITVPSKEIRNTIGGLDPHEGKVPDDFEIEKTQEFDLPENLPSMKATLKVQATAKPKKQKAPKGSSASAIEASKKEKTVTKVSCEREIEIVHVTP